MTPEIDLEKQRAAHALIRRKKRSLLPPRFEFPLTPVGVRDLIKPMLRIPKFQLHTSEDTLVAIADVAEALGRPFIKRLERSGLTIKVNEPPEWRYPQGSGYYREGNHQIQLCRQYLGRRTVLTNLARAYFAIFEERRSYDDYWAGERFDGLFKWGRWNQFQSRQQYFVDSLLLYMKDPEGLKKRDQGCAMFFEMLLARA